MNSKVMTAGSAPAEQVASRAEKVTSFAMRLDKGRSQTLEERFNTLTHAVGAGMSIAGLIFLLLAAQHSGADAITYIAFAIYGAMQILLYLSSSMLHQFIDVPAWYKPLHILDQSAIYLLIAGTYTPVTLLALQGTWGWSLFGVIWGLALLGILMKSIFIRGKHIATDLLYLPMGWLVAIALKPLAAVMPPGFFIWAALGAASYTIGIIFYIFEKIPMSHVIWHLFVISGSLAFYIGFLKYLV